mmetsp:Transcript_34706/g.63368  ORF Transcript_34706/g.63368 Transcript_34706/m.63368 type:complete len:439 (-) Transcript_34706:97-1413(-)
MGGITFYLTQKLFLLAASLLGIALSAKFGQTYQSIEVRQEPSSVSFSRTSSNSTPGGGAGASKEPGATGAASRRYEEERLQAEIDDFFRDADKASSASRSVVPASPANDDDDDAGFWDTPEGQQELERQQEALDAEYAALFGGEEAEEWTTIEAGGRYLSYNEAGLVHFSGPISPTFLWNSEGRREAGDNQKWKIEDAGDDTYKIASLSGKYLSTAGPRSIGLSPKAQDNTKWSIVGAGNGEVLITANTKYVSHDLSLSAEAGINQKWVLPHFAKAWQCVGTSSIGKHQVECADRKVAGWEFLSNTLKNGTNIGECGYYDNDAKKMVGCECCKRPTADFPLSKWHWLERMTFRPEGKCVNKEAYTDYPSASTGSPWFKSCESLRNYPEQEPRLKQWDESQVQGCFDAAEPSTMQYSCLKDTESECNKMSSKCEWIGTA